MDDPRPAGGRRAFTALLALTTILLSASPATATGPVYDAARGCVNSAPTTPYSSTYRGGALYETLGSGETIGAATRLRDQLESAHVFETWQTLFASSGRTVLPRGPGGGAQYEIYVVGDLDAGLAGLLG